jgi:hypothetical protein
MLEQNNFTGANNSPGKEITMKNTFNFNLGEINVTIEGTPVQISNFQMEYTNEASVQELATSASFIKDLIGEIKSAIKEAQASAAQYQPASASTITTEKADVTEPKKTEQRWDLASVWNVMMAKKPEGFKKTGIGHYTFECGSMKEKNRIRCVIEFKQDSIDCDITVQDSTAFCHLYEDAEYSSISGINAALIGELIEALPGDIKDFVSDYIKKITK